MRTTLVLPVCLTAALLAAGCGGSRSQDSAKDFKGEQRVVAVAVEDLEEAGRDDAPARICGDLLADSLLRRLRQAGTNCRVAVSEGLDDADDFGLEVEQISISGVRATARVTSGDGDDEKTEVISLERDGRAWKIASLGTG